MDFLVLDVETANPNMASICQIGVAGFSNGTEVLAERRFVDPQDYFDPWHVSIHGIREEHVAGAECFGSLRPWLADLLSENVVISHTAYDRVSLVRACTKCRTSAFTCRWLDSAMIVRRAWPQYARVGYGLGNLAAELGIQFAHHDALEDARTAAKIVFRILAETGTSVDDWLERVRRPITAPAPRQHIDGAADGPLAGEVVVITGQLALPRREMAALIAATGADVDTSVTKRTTILVVGDQDISRLGNGEKSGKHRRAEELMTAGQPIRIVGESDLQEFLS